MGASVIHVAIHESQFPGNVRRDLLDSLRSRKVNHKFHYDSVEQTQKWLAIHEAYSPSRTDPDCGAIYERAFEDAAKWIQAGRAHVIGLGCGGGRKDSMLLKRLHDQRNELFYTPSDVSTAMVLVAWGEATKLVPETNCFPLVCDLATASDLREVLENAKTSRAARFITFFGMIPNFEPELILPRLAALVGPGDVLLFSANLAPGPNYAAGVRKILPLYDNQPTKDWLLTFLTDLGIEPTAGTLDFKIETVNELQRITAWFQFVRDQKICIEAEAFEFKAGDSLRLFFSYRHTPAIVRALLEQHGLQVREQWLTRSEEEGVFLVARG